MIAKIKNNISNLSVKYPEWEQIVGRFFADQDISSEDENVVDEFGAIIIAICDAVKKDACSIEEATALFSDGLQTSIRRELRSRLRPYFDCTVIRKNEKTSRTQLEYFIDELWQQSIIRRNPAYQIDAEKCEKLAVSNEEIEKFTITLSAIVDHCVSRLLNYDGMVNVICDQTGISQEFSEYIARKIEKDNEALRINFIIKRLVGLSNRR